MGLLADIAQNFTKLANFGGRATRRQFWPYVGVVFAFFFAAGAAYTIPTVSASIARLQRFAAEHPELSHVESGPGYYSVSIEGYHPELMPDVRGFMVFLDVTVALLVLLLAAAVARRLHDRGKSAFWGLAPLPFLAVGLVAAPMLMQSIDAERAAGRVADSADLLRAVLQQHDLSGGAGLPGLPAFGR